MILSNETSFKILDLLLYKLSEHNLFPVIGAEIEFYLSPIDNSENNDLWQAPVLDIGIEMEKEKGTNQFEVKIDHNSDIRSQIQKLDVIKQSIRKNALKQGVVANFEAKPYLEQPGSALHVHLNLENDKQENLFIKNGDNESDLLLKSIGGLCDAMKETMLFFAPYEKAYLRYQVEHVTTPSKICWGGNNRSAAIRIPLDQKYNRRIEHRVACADSSPIEVINAILFGILKGIEEELTPPKKLHGNAFLEQYEYPRITRDLRTAIEDFKTGSFVSFMANVF